jgi:hypothetical protein
MSQTLNVVEAKLLSDVSTRSSGPSDQILGRLFKGIQNEWDMQNPPKREELLIRFWPTD